MDLISKLADALVALNNASPRLPRKEQIEEVLRASEFASTTQAAVDAAMMDAFPAFIVTRDGTLTLTGTITADTVPNEHTLTWSELPSHSGTPYPYLATQGQLVQAADDICAKDQPRDYCNGVDHTWGAYHQRYNQQDWVETRCVHCGATK